MPGRGGGRLQSRKPVFESAQNKLPVSPQVWGRLGSSSGEYGIWKSAGPSVCLCSHCRGPGARDTDPDARSFCGVAFPLLSVVKPVPLPSSFQSVFCALSAYVSV